MIRIATNQEALEILNEPQNQKSIGLVTEEIFKQPWMVKQGKYRMVFWFFAVEDALEVHICCPKRSILGSREMAKEILNWLFNLGAHRVVTNCQEGRIANTVRKMGMKEYKKSGNKLFFEVLSWV